MSLKKEWIDSVSTIFTRVLLVLICTLGCQLANAQIPPLQALQTIEYNGNNRVQDYTIPSGIKEISFKVKGGSGGNAIQRAGVGCFKGDITYYGGEGAYMEITYLVGKGSSPHHLAEGGTLRVLVGQNGDTASDGCGGISMGGGGGSSGIAYLPPDKEGNSPYWYTLVIAAGGGGARHGMTIKNAGEGGDYGSTSYKYSAHGTLNESYDREKEDNQFLGGGLLHHDRYAGRSFYYGGAVKEGLGHGYNGSYKYIRGTPVSYTYLTLPTICSV